MIPYKRFSGVGAAQSHFIFDIFGLPKPSFLARLTLVVYKVKSELLSNNSSTSKTDSCSPVSVPNSVL